MRNNIQLFLSVLEKNKKKGKKIPQADFNDTRVRVNKAGHLLSYYGLSQYIILINKKIFF